MLSFVSHQDETKHEKKIAQRTGSDLACLKIRCLSETDSMGSAAALLDRFRHQWRVIGKPKREINQRKV